MMHADRTNKARKANTMTKASRSTQNPSRRRFLEFVAASPLLAAGAGPALAELIQKAEDLPADKMWLDLVEGLIASPDEAVNIFDFEAVTKVRLPPAHFGFLASGVGGEETLRANRVAFEDYVLKPRRLIDVSQPDLSTTVLGETFSSPVGLAPLGSQLVFHREAEAATARAAATGNHLQILSTQTNTELARVNEARGKPVWFQLYASDSPDLARQRIRHAEEAGCPVLVVTVDLVGKRVLETKNLLRRTDTRDCKMCHGATTMDERVRFLPMYRDFDLTGVRNPMDPSMTWDTLKRLRDGTDMKVVIKGLLTPEDAAIAVAQGFDGIVVSNHGGRADESGLATIDALPAIVSQVAGAVPIIVDSGFRRGSDIIKALCMGADMVCVGRPYIWGLTAFGQPGVEKVLELLDAETQVMMQQVGAARVADLDAAMVGRS